MLVGRKESQAGATKPYCNDPSFNGSQQPSSILVSNTSSHLLFRIDGRVRLGFIDNQSSRNFISHEHALRLGVSIEEGKGEAPILGDLTVAKAIGRITTRCTVVLDRKYTLHCVFQVLEQCAVPIVLGRPFLCTLQAASVTASLGQYHHFSHFLYTPLNDIKLVLRVCNSARTEKVLATIDQGSTDNVVSLKLARSLSRLHGAPRSAGSWIQLGDGHLKRSLGSVQIQVLLPKPDGTKCKLRLDLDVVADLAFELVLGAPTARTIRMLTAQQGVQLEWTMVEEERNLLCMIRMFGRDSKPSPDDETVAQSAVVDSDAIRRNQRLELQTNARRDRIRAKQRQDLEKKRDGALEKRTRYLGELDKALERKADKQTIAGLREKVADAEQLYQDCNSSLNPTPAETPTASIHDGRPTQRRHGYGHTLFPPSLRSSRHSNDQNHIIPGKYRS